MTAKQTFATICSALAAVKPGDTVMVSTSTGVEPTRYTMERFTDTGGLLLVGVRGARRELVIAPAEKTVWLCKRGHGRRVVQAWVEPGEKRQPSATHHLGIHVKESGDKLVLSFDGRTVETERNADSIADAIEHFAATTPFQRDDVADAVDLVTLPDAFHASVEAMSIALGVEFGDGCSDLAALETISARMTHLAQDHANLGTAFNELLRKTERVERERDAALVSLAQLRNIADGRAPGTTPLPSNTSPSTVAIEVIAALYRGANR